jgi:hypothetical protein
MGLETVGLGKSLITAGLGGITVVAKLWFDHANVSFRTRLGTGETESLVEGFFQRPTAGYTINGTGEMDGKVLAKIRIQVVVGNPVFFFPPAIGQEI